MNAAITQQIEHLDELTELLRDEAVAQTIDQRLTARGLACGKALQTANTLIKELQQITVIAGIDTRQLMLQGCDGCNDQ